MKTFIYISGQIQSSLTLLININAASDAGLYVANLAIAPDHYRLLFSTKKDAKRALWLAFKALYTQYIYENGRIDYSQISYSKHGILSYDSSKAEIRTEQL